MGYEWGRFLWWLGQGQNAAAVQALCAIAAGVITLVLACITWHYVVLTGRMSEVSKRQVIAQFLPTLSIDLTATYSTGNVTFDITNDGNRSAGLFNIDVAWYLSGDDKKQGRVGVHNPDKKILHPGEKFSLAGEIPEEHVADSEADFFNKITVLVDCTDLNAPGKHCFSVSRNAGTRYYDSFQAAGRIEELTQAPDNEYRA